MLRQGILSLEGIVGAAPLDAELKAAAKKSDTVAAMDEIMEHTYSEEELKEKQKKPMPTDNIRKERPTTAQGEHAVAKFFARRRGLEIKRSTVCSGMGVFATQDFKKGTTLGFVQGMFSVEEPQDLWFKRGVVRLKLSPDRAWTKAQEEAGAEGPPESSTGVIYMGLDENGFAAYINDPKGPLATRALRPQFEANTAFQENPAMFPLEDHRYCWVIMPPTHTHMQFCAQRLSSHILTSCLLRPSLRRTSRKAQSSSSTTGIPSGRRKPILKPLPCWHVERSERRRGAGQRQRAPSHPRRRHPRKRRRPERGKRSARHQFQKMKTVRVPWRAG
jgi:hypothetical protein